jgi:spore maturation protein CgeB
MPAVFKSARINLNSTLRANRTGIPLRVVDVLGAGGFLLTNIQSEMLDFFKEDELATYETTAEAIEKISFYLENEDLRHTIAAKGHERILKDFTYEDRLSRMLAN